METLVLEENRIESSLVKANVTDAVIADLKDKYSALKIEGVEDKQGYALVNSARIECKNVRVLAEKVCKKGREAAVLEQKAWIAKEKEVVAKISEIEDYLETQQRAIDTEKARIQMEKEAEFERQRLQAEKLLNEKIQKRGGQMLKYGITGDYEFMKNASDVDFETQLASVITAWDQEQERLAVIEADKKAEGERLEKQRIDQEAERLRLEAIAIEQAEKAAVLQRQQDKIEADKKAAESAKQKEIEDKRRADELEQARKEAAELAKKQAEDKVRKDAEAKAEADRKAQEAAKRKEARRPDKVKLIALAEAIEAYPLPELKCDEALQIIEATKGLLSKVSAYLKTKAEEL